MSLKITDVRAILTAPEKIPLVVVRVDTSDPGLYGLGCATYTQRFLTVKDAVENYMKPFFVGKDPRRIQDLWQSAMVSPYWRNGPVLNNALSGVDMALWDIKGKLAGMPLYDLLGGKCREAAAVYRHADGRDLPQVEENVRKFMADGVRHVRVQWGGYGGRSPVTCQPDGACDGAYYDPMEYFRSTVKLVDYIRDKVGFEVDLLHDVHERLLPIDAVRLAKELEPYRLFFLEDALAPEMIEWFETIRSQSATPIAMGELFNHPREWTPLIVGRLIDYIRVHISQIGGLTPAIKLANFCEQYGVRTAWHGPGDVSPIGHAVNVHLDLTCWNFGIQEWAGFRDPIYEVFTGLPELRKGYVYLSDKPGIGVDMDEAAAARFPCNPKLPEWTNARWPDGTIARP